MTSIDRKIMFGGYNSDKGYPRKRINDFLDLEDGEQPIRKTHKKRKSCKYNKGVHEYELVEEGVWKWINTGKKWYHYKCKHCGKLKYEYD